MAEIDTSSYPKPAALPAQKTFLETAGQFQQLERGHVGLQKEKLALVNQRYGILLNELNSLGPDATPDQLRMTAQNAVKMGLIPAEMATQFIGQIPTNQAEIPNFIKSTISKLSTTQQIVNWRWGVPGNVDTGQVQQPVTVSPWNGQRANGPAIPNEIPPTAPTINPVTNQQQFFGSQPQRPPAAQPALPVEGPPIRPNVVQTTREAPPQRLPVVPPVRFGDGSTAVPTPVPAPIPQPTGPVTAMPPGEQRIVDDDAAKLIADRNLATEKLQGITPLRQVMPMLTNTITGIGTDTFNRGRAALINLGLIEANESDPTVVYQTINKLMSQYIQRSGLANRSDAQQALGESSSPNAKTQILPALTKIVREVVALDRMEALRGLSWDKQSPVGYGSHRSKFPASIDERALSLDMLPIEKRQNLILEMQKKRNTTEGKRFERTLELAIRSGLFNLSDL